MFGKIKLLLFFVAITVVFLMGCATTSIGPIGGKYPETPEGQCLIYPTWTIDTFDGANADWEDGDYIVIPAGKHTLKCVRRRQLRIIDNSFTVKNPDGSQTRYIDLNSVYLQYDVIWEVTYEFQKGKSYYISGGNFYISGDESKDKAIVTIQESIEFTFDEKRFFATAKPKIEVTESKGIPYIRPEATGLFGAGLAYGGVTLGQFGERFGIGILSGKMDLKLVGLGQVGGLGTFFPDGGGFGLQYNFGGLVEQHFPKVGIGAGGGMWGSYLDIREKDKYGNLIDVWIHQLQPYLELNISFRKGINLRHQVIYFHYFPSGDNWYNTFGVGWKTNLIN